MERRQLIGQIENYQTHFEEEALFVPRFLSLLRNFPDCFHRKQTTGHLTASAWIESKCGGKVLLLHHAKLCKWLQPGGHADGDENLLNVAQKEAEEETGLTSLQFVHRTIFDLDIHQIPAYRDVKTHLHFDTRFLFFADSDEPLCRNDESIGLRWIPLNEVSDFAKNNLSIHRMILKTKLTFNSIN